MGWGQDRGGGDSTGLGSGAELQSPCTSLPIEPVPMGQNVLCFLVGCLTNSEYTFLLMLIMLVAFKITRTTCGMHIYSFQFYLLHFLSS